jgi:hypothetical protein
MSHLENSIIISFERLQLLSDSIDSITRIAARNSSYFSAQASNDIVMYLKIWNRYMNIIFESQDFKTEDGQYGIYKPPFIETYYRLTNAFKNSFYNHYTIDDIKIKAEFQYDMIRAIGNLYTIGCVLDIPMYDQIKKEDLK